MYYSARNIKCDPRPSSKQFYGVSNYEHMQMEQKKGKIVYSVKYENN